MTKIALALAIICISIPSLAQAKEGYQTIGDFTVKYPNKFNYSELWTKLIKEAFAQEGVEEPKKIAAYYSAGICGFEQTNIYEIDGEKVITPEEIARETTEGISEGEEGAIVIVEPLEISNLKAAYGSVEINNPESNLVSDSVHIVDNKKVYWQLVFVGSIKGKKDVEKAHSCAMDIIKTIEITN